MFYGKSKLSVGSAEHAISFELGTIFDPGTPQYHVCNAKTWSDWRYMFLKFKVVDYFFVAVTSDVDTRVENGWEISWVNIHINNTVIQINGRSRFQKSDHMRFFFLYILAALEVANQAGWRKTLCTYFEVPSVNLTLERSIALSSVFFKLNIAEVKMLSHLYSL